MASQTKPLRDWLYLSIIGTQLFGMLVLDLVDFYPRALWFYPSSPLHFLSSLRRFYISYFADPFFIDQPHRPWFRVFLAVEGLLQLPLTAYLVSNLASRRSTSGPAELAGVAYGCLTFMGALACSSELWHMVPDTLSEKKAPLMYGSYFPFVVIPGIMAADMYLRLLPRLRPDTKAKTQ